MLKYISNNWILILTFLLIYTSDDTIMFGMFGNIIFYYAKLIIWFLVVIIFAIRGTFIKQKLIKSLIMALMFYTLNALISGFSIGFIYNIAIFLIALVYVSNVPIEKFKEYFTNIVCFFAIGSSIVYVLNIIFPQLFSGFPTLYNAANLPYKIVYISIIFESLTLRNFGIFREPGMYMIYLNIALFLEWFSDKPSKFKIISYVFALLTTVSTAGLLIGSMIFISGSLIQRNKFVFIMLLPLIGLGYYFLTQEDSIYYTLLLGKLEEGNGTTIARVSSITVPLQIFFEHPLGTGPALFNELFPLYTQRMFGLALDADLSTNTFTKNLAVYGPFLFMLYLVYLLRFIKSCYSKRLTRFIFFLILLLGMSNEDIRSSILYFLMLAYGANYSFNNFFQSNIIRNENTVL